jgi:hypothetical protein
MRQEFQMTKKNLWIGILALALVFTIMVVGCNPDIEEDIDVTFIDVSADGSSSETTTELTLAFSQAITGLSASNITLSGVSGVTKGRLSSSGKTYTLPISGFSSGGTLKVTVSKTGYNISGSPKTAAIFYYNSGNGGGNEGGTFTLTGIPSEYNGKYAYLLGKTEPIIGLQSVNLSTQTNTLCLISNGRVSLPLWTYTDGNNDFVRYSGNNTSDIEIMLFNTQTLSIDAEMLGSLKLSSVTFANGSASMSWGQGEFDDGEGGNVDVTNVTLAPNSLSLTVGSSITLTAIIAPINATNKNVEWYSSNDNVASVNNGVVTAISAGTATITVTTVDGGKSAACSVTVTSGSGGGTEGTYGDFTYTETTNVVTITRYTGAGGSVTIPAQINGKPVTSIGDMVFFQCNSLTNIILPNSVNSLGRLAFYECTSLTSITIGNSVTSIGDSAFSATSLTSITIPNSVTSIGDYAFDCCYSLTSVTFEGTIVSGNFSSVFPFPGDLRDKYLAGGPGWYTLETNSGFYWTKTTAVTLNSVIPNGSSTQTTTRLTLTFSKAITGLSASDITLTGVSGVTKGKLSSSGSTYTLLISGFRDGGSLTVAVSKIGYSISGSPKTVTIYYNFNKADYVIVNQTSMPDSAPEIVWLKNSIWLMYEENEHVEDWMANYVKTNKIKTILSSENKGLGWINVVLQDRFYLNVEELCYLHGYDYTVIPQNPQRGKWYVTAAHETMHLAQYKNGDWINLMTGMRPDICAATEMLTEFLAWFYTEARFDGIWDYPSAYVYADMENAVETQSKYMILSTDPWEYDNARAKDPSLPIIIHNSPWFNNDASFYAQYAFTSTLFRIRAMTAPLKQASKENVLKAARALLACRDPKLAGVTDEALWIVFEALRKVVTGESKYLRFNTDDTDFLADRDSFDDFQEFIAEWDRAYAAQ